MEFDSFSEFYEKLNSYYVDKPGKKPPTKNEVQLMIEEIMAAKVKIGKKERRDYYLLKTYDVLCVTDQKFLIYKKTNEEEDIRYVVPFEELYDRIKDFHIKTGHGGIVKLRMSMGHKYKIPRPAIEKFLSVCAICNSKQGANRKLVIKPIITKDFNERGQIDLIDFQSTPDGKYKWIMNYQDHSTKFLLLHPLETKWAIEVANKLLSIFLTFGAPKILQSDNGREYVNSVIKELKDLWPQCVIVHGRPRHPQSQGSIERSNQDIENMIRAWMKDNQSKKWSVGLQFVQFQKNSSFHRIIGRSPYKALFGCDPKVGLSSSNLPSELIKKLTTEEHLEEILNNIQPEQKKKEMTSNCKICNKEMLTEVEFSGTIICDLCKTNKIIKEQRQLGYQGQKKAVEIMLKASQTRTPDLKIGDCVLITVPKVDRGPSDPANVIAVIVKQNEHKLHQLGTKYGLVKGWYNSASLKPATSNFIKITEVNNDKELTLRETVSHISGGQGFLSCICKRQCETKRCACFKASVKCNSRCHNTNIFCKNI